MRKPFHPSVSFISLLILTIAAQQSQGQSPKTLKQVENCVNRVQGTWILVKRINPNGKEHAKPLKGETIFKFSLDRKTGRAIGEFSAVETGILDAGFSGFNPGEDVINPDPTSSNVMFEISAKGPVEVTVDPAAPAVANLTYLNSEIKGTYGVFRSGVRTPRMESKYRMTSSFLFRAASMTLVNEPRMNIALEMKGPGSLGDQSHKIRSQVIRGDRMDITYGNGGKDIWSRKR